MNKAKIVVSREQCRAARGLLNLSQSQVAEAAHIGQGTLSEFERGDRVPSYNNMQAIRIALEANGVQFVAQNGGGIGVRLHTAGDGDALDEAPLTPSLCWAARRLLDLTQQQLADAAGLGLSTVADFERGIRVPLVENLVAIRSALGATGVVFIPADSDGGAGVRLKK